MFGLGFWRELNTPENFVRDWYGELTNQFAHTLLGVVLAVGVCSIWQLVAGELPYRTWVFLGLFAGYLSVEILVQGWTPGDSWFDAIMFSLGVAGAIMPFQEAAISGRLVMVTFGPLIWIAIAGVWSAILFARVARRYIASGATQSK